jgi:hypothetical protein
MYLILDCCIGKWREIFANIPITAKWVVQKRGKGSMMCVCVWRGSGICFTNMMRGGGWWWWLSPIDGYGRICQFTGASTSVWSVSQSDQFSRNGGGDGGKREECVQSGCLVLYGLNRRSMRNHRRRIAVWCVRLRNWSKMNILADFRRDSLSDLRCTLHRIHVIISLSVVVERMCLFSSVVLDIPGSNLLSKLDCPDSLLMAFLSPW